MLSWISSDINLIRLVETWEHDESRVPHLDGFTLCSAWNNKSAQRGFGGIECYTRNIVSSHIRLHKIDPFNQYNWIEISDSTTNRIFLAICYFTPINTISYKKNNLDKNCPFNTLERDIYNLRNEGNILLLGDFNGRTATNQVIMLSNNSNLDPLWLDEDSNLANRFKRNSKDIIENLFSN